MIQRVCTTEVIVSGPGPGSGRAGLLLLLAASFDFCQPVVTRADDQQVRQRVGVGFERRTAVDVVHL
jgi:hypothetical protein